MNLMKNLLLVPTVGLLALNVSANETTDSENAIELGLGCENLLDINSMGAWEDPALLTLCALGNAPTAAGGNTNSFPTSRLSEIGDNQTLANNGTLNSQPTAGTDTPTTPDPVVTTPTPVVTTPTTPAEPELHIAFNSDQVIYTRFETKANNQQQLGTLSIDSPNRAGSLHGSPIGDTAPIKIDISAFDQAGNLINVDGNSTAEFNQVDLRENIGTGSILSAFASTQINPRSTINHEVHFDKLPDFWKGHFIISRNDKRAVILPAIPFFDLPERRGEETVKSPVAVGNIAGGLRTPLNDLNRILAAGSDLQYSGLSAFHQQQFNMTVNVTNKTVGGSFSANTDVPGFSFEGNLVGSNVVSTSVSGVDSGFVQGTFIGNTAERLAGAYQVVSDTNTIADVFSAQKVTEQ